MGDRFKPESVIGMGQNMHADARGVVCLINAIALDEQVVIYRRRIGVKGSVNKRILEIGQIPDVGARGIALAGVEQRVGVARNGLRRFCVDGDRAFERTDRRAVVALAQMELRDGQSRVESRTATGYRHTVVPTPQCRHIGKASRPPHCTTWCASQLPVSPELAAMHCGEAL